MLAGILVVLFLLWLLGYVDIPVLHINDIVLFTIFGHPITLFNIATFLLVIWVLELLPQPIRSIAIFIFIIWILSVLGILTISWLPNIIVLLIILGFISMII